MACQQGLPLGLRSAEPGRSHGALYPPPTHPLTPSFTRSRAHSLIYSPTRSFMGPFIHSFIPFLIHSLIHTHSFTQSLIHSFTYSLTHSFIHFKSFTESQVPSQEPDPIYSHRASDPIKVLKKFSQERLGPRKGSPEVLMLFELSLRKVSWIKGKGIPGIGCRRQRHRAVR